MSEFNNGFFFGLLMAGITLGPFILHFAALANAWRRIARKLAADADT